jgi:hypothetical protein
MTSLAFFFGVLPSPLQPAQAPRYGGHRHNGWVGCHGDDYCLFYIPLFFVLSPSFLRERNRPMGLNNGSGSDSLQKSIPVSKLLQRDNAMVGKKIFITLTALS